MANFKIRDRVVYQLENSSYSGRHGTVCALKDGLFGVAFDEPVGLHSCGGACEIGYGKWASPYALVYETGLSSIPENKLMEVIFSEI